MSRFILIEIDIHLKFLWCSFNETFEGISSTCQPKTFFSNEGILPSSETPEISSSVRITMLSDELAEEDALVILNKGLLSFILMYSKQGVSARPPFMNSVLTLRLAATKHLSSFSRSWRCNLFVLNLINLEISLNTSRTFEWKNNEIYWNWW